MKIYIDGVKQNIPEFLKIDSMSEGITVNSEKINDGDGEVITGSYLNIKSLSCSGVVFHTSRDTVENEKARIMAILSGKELVVYRNENSSLFYRCRLAGEVKTSFYNGAVTGRAFMISFVMKSFTPYSYGESYSKTLTAGANSILNSGTDKVIPTIVISGPRTVSGTVFICGTTSIKLKNSIYIQEGTSLTYNEKGLWLINVDYTNTLLDETLITPLSIDIGENTIVSTVTATLVFNPRYK